MSFSDTDLGGAIVVRSDGRVDLSNADAFTATLVAAVGAARAAVIVDMAGVDYISSAGLRSLMIAMRSAKAAGKAFAVAALTPLVLEIFTISRFNLVFSIHASVRDALAVVAPDALGQFDRT